MFLGTVFHEYLDGEWEQSRGYLREELEQLRNALQHQLDADEIITTINQTVTNTITTSGGITQLTGDVTAGPGSGSQIATLSNTAVTPGTYGNSTNVSQVTVNSKGRVTAAANVAINFSPNGAYAPLTFGTEPITFVSNGVGAPVMVAFIP